MTDWRNIFNELRTSGSVFTVYLRYMQRDTLAKIPNVRVSDIYDEHVKLENPSGYGIVSYEDILYLSVPR
ncbi:MAG: hypothetical protein ACW98Y_21950 [Candidatus Thorarchaeota archaeon]|jgi:hypothetical protein